LPILDDRPGAMWATVVQPIMSVMVKEGSGRSGGNLSGLSEYDGNLFCENFKVLLTFTLIHLFIALTVFHCATFWADAKDDSSMKQGSSELQSWVEMTAHERGFLHPFIHMNYAFARQKVYKGVGMDNSQRTKSHEAKV